MIFYLIVTSLKSREEITLRIQGYTQAAEL